MSTQALYVTTECSDRGPQLPPPPQPQKSAELTRNIQIMKVELRRASFPDFALARTALVILAVSLFRRAFPEGRGAASSLHPAQPALGGGTLQQVIANAGSVQAVIPDEKKGENKRPIWRTVCLLTLDRWCARHRWPQRSHASTV